MASSALINSLLDGIHKIQDKGDFVDDSDLSFLKDYFECSKVLFSVMDCLESHDGVPEINITAALFDDVSGSVRRISKKNRDAAKLLHILKKPIVRAFFNSLEQLKNQTYIPEPYTGELHEIDIDFRHVPEYLDERDYRTGSETLSENSVESEEISEETRNLPSYQDAQYGISRNEDISDDFQIVQFQRDPNKPLGITVTKHDFIYGETQMTRCMVERVLVNSLIDKQDVLHVGDIIIEVNNTQVETPDELQTALSKNSGLVNFKIIKSSKRPMSNIINMEKSYVRSLFDYDPATDKLIPNESIGLAFKCGDVFEILNREDPNFWQAAPLNFTSSQALLVPSQALQERRIALESDMRMKSNENHTFGKAWRRKSKTNELFRAQNSVDIIGEADLRTYEDVVKFPPSRVPCLLLLGPPGVGKRAIKHILVQKEPNRFAFPIQDTTEPKRGRNQPLFNHVDKNTMMNDIKSSLYVCVEEREGEVYGVKSSTIRELINQNKTVVLDCRPKDVYSVKLPIFNPYVMLICAPALNILESMQKEGLSGNLTKNKRSTAELQDIIDQSNKYQIEYQHLINSVIVNESFLKTAHSISQRVTEFEGSDSWVPAGWENDMIPLPIVPKESARDSLKSPDNLSIGQNTIQRRFEKKSEKTSSLLPGNKVNISAKSQNMSYSDNSSETYSENEVVKAKPLNYSVPEQKRNEELDSSDEQEPVPIKPKQRVSLTRQGNKPLIKGESLKVRENEPKAVAKLPDVAPKPKDVTITAKVTLKPSVKKDDSREKENIKVSEKESKKVPGKEKPVVRAQEKEKEIAKVPDKETVRAHGKQPPVKQQEKPAIVRPKEKEVGKPQAREEVRVPVKEKVPQQSSANKVQARPKLIKMRGSSSSDMSDTTSEEEGRGLQENRV